MEQKRSYRGVVSAQPVESLGSQGYARLNFQSPIDVDNWVQRVGHAAQQRIDVAVVAIKNSEPVPSEFIETSDTKSLKLVSAALDELCERLAQTPNMSVGLAEELLRLDAIAQDLRRLATDENLAITHLGYCQVTDRIAVNGT